MLNTDLFDEAWYLRNNPDIRDAVEAGLLSARDHFEQYGKTEGRSPGPSFDPSHYLSKNPDVQDAVDAGLFNAYDHFVNHGATEGRDFAPYFDAEFYLSKNPDVADAVEQGLMTAVEHFLMYGQGEPRAISPFFDLGAYVEANPDIRDAVDAGSISPLQHLLTYGVSESRELGNGVNLGQFANDPTFQAAMAEGGNPFDAIARVAEVTPFLPTFEAPAGWEAPATTPIPVNFVPADGEKLVIPPTVIVPDDVELPDDVFEPVEPAPEPVDPGGGGSPGITVEITSAKNLFEGSSGRDTFNAEDEGTIRTGLTIDGKAGTDTLNIGAGAIALDAVVPGKSAAPGLENVEIINNMHVGPALGRTIDNGYGVWLNLENAPDLKQVWTDFRDVVWGEEPPSQGQYGGVKSTAGVGVFYENANFATTVFGIRKVHDVGTNDDTKFGGHANISFNGAGAGETLRLNLEGNDENSFYRAGQSDKFQKYDIHASKDNGGTLAVGVKVEEISIRGQGDLAIRARNFEKLKTVNAENAEGKIHFGAVDGSSGKLGLASGFSVITGSGDDTIDIRGVTTEGKISTGAGDDTIIFDASSNITITGGADANTYEVFSEVKPGDAKTTYTFITDYKKGDVIDLTQVTNADFGTQTAIYSSNTWAQDEGAPIEEGGTIIKLLNSKKGSSPIIILDSTLDDATTIELKVSASALPEALTEILTGESVTVLTSIADGAEISAAGMQYHGVMLVGGSGQQTLTGSAGSDILMGGDGEDTYVLDEGYGTGDRIDERDVIIEFGAGDRIQVDALLSGDGTISDEGVTGADFAADVGDWWLDGQVLNVVVAAEGTPIEVISVQVLGSYTSLSVDDDGYFVVV